MAESIKTKINIGNILYSFLRMCITRAAPMSRQKQRAVRGVSKGKIPVSHGIMIPTQPKSSRTPSMRSGIIDAFGFM